MERASQQLRERLALTGERVAAAAARAGRDPAEIRILAVTKTQPRARVEDALEAGLRLIGENRVQEADAKLFPVPPGAELHLIGHLQRNKARRAAELFHTVQSIDKVETAVALHRVLRRRDASDPDEPGGRGMDLLLELNTSGETAKHGFASETELQRAMDAIAQLDRIRVRGLMTMAVWSNDARAVRRCFQRLRRLFERLAPGRDGFDTLSMGMSADYELAIEEGATLIRLGTALFGPREQPPALAAGAPDA
jgi:pyridoxal phosphate enzyme (YggS family)